MKILLILAALGIYGWGVWKFMEGVKYTHYTSGTALPLALIWPVLLIGSRSFRTNFQKALRGKGGG